MKRVALPAVLALAVAICTFGTVARANTAGALFTMTNNANGNLVVAFARDQEGQLSLLHRYPTDGKGAGVPLGNASGIAMTTDGRFLLVVNAGSNDVSVFGINGATLHLIDREPSGGKMPISVTESRHIVYVLNAGGNVGGKDTINGFQLGFGGKLMPISGSMRPLSAASTGPAQVGFSLDGRDLVVTEKNTSLIDIYTVRADGLVDGPFSHGSGAPTPFGFTFDLEDHLLVSDAAAKMQNAAGLSSYTIDPGHGLQPISAFSPDNQTAACWVVVTRDGTTAFVANTGSGTISGFHDTLNGVLMPLNGGMPLASTGAGSGPIDMAQSHDGRFLYVLDGGAGAISAFSEHAGGQLGSQLGVSGLPLSVNGLVGF